MRRPTFHVGDTVSIVTSSMGRCGLVGTVVDKDGFLYRVVLQPSGLTTWYAGEALELLPTMRETA